MIKRNPSLTEQVKTYLKQRINNAEFEDGRIPAEMQLAAELNVSRNTVRDALSRLEMEGIIFRRQGAGTFINEANLLVKTRLEEIVPYTTLIAEHGYRPSVQLFRVDEQQVAPEIARNLEIEPVEPVLLIQKLFLADDQPVIFTDTIIPTGLLTQSYTAADFLAPPYEFLTHLSQQTLAYYLTDIVPLMAPSWLADQLDLPHSQTALLSFEEIGFNQAHEPLLKATSYFRDDLLRLRLIRRHL
jgi:GntR family transcriptional regulator